MILLQMAQKDWWEILLDRSCLLWFCCYCGCQPHFPNRTVKLDVTRAALLMKLPCVLQTHHPKYMYAFRVRLTPVGSVPLAIAVYFYYVY